MRARLARYAVKYENDGHHLDGKFQISKVFLASVCFDMLLLMHPLKESLLQPICLSFGEELTEADCDFGGVPKLFCYFDCVPQAPYFRDVGLA